MSLFATAFPRRTWPALLLSALLPLQAFAQQAAPLDVPYVPTPEAVVHHMLEMAKVGPQDRVIDLGSGDGRIAIAAVKARGAQSALGVDLDPERVREANANAKAAKVTDRVTFEQGDLFQKDISQATVLTLYLLPRVNMRLRPVILDRLAPGTRVVSHAFSMEDWEADQTAIVDGNYIYLWIVPAKVDGQWQVRQGDERFTLTLDQRFQAVAGQAQRNGDAHAVEGRLAGQRLTFTLGDRQYVGQVEGDRITAVAEDGAVANWSATRS